MIGAAINSRSWAWARMLAGIAILGLLVVQVGAEPFVDGLRRTSPGAVLVALLVTAGTTACCAWRWSLLARRLDVKVPLGAAYRHYYRSQVLNATLPGGVLGDLHRGVAHGRDAGALGRGLRSVVWDRASGQAVQAVIALGAVLLLPATVRSTVGWGAGVAVVAAAVGVGVLPPRARRRLVAEVRSVPAAPGVWPQVVLASALAAAGHAAVFVVAARAAGVTAPLAQLVALAFVVLLAASVPLSVAGWGPREGATAWLFGAAGLGVGVGVTVAVVYGVLSLLATLPGLLVLARPQRRATEPAPMLATGAEEVARG